MTLLCAGLDPSGAGPARWTEPQRERKPQLGAPLLLQRSCLGPSSCHPHPSVPPGRGPSMQVQGSAPHVCAAPQKQCGQGQHLLPGAQLSHGG